MHSESLIAAWNEFTICTTNHAARSRETSAALTQMSGLGPSEDDTPEQRAAWANLVALMFAQLAASQRVCTAMLDLCAALSTEARQADTVKALSALAPPLYQN